VLIAAHRAGTGLAGSSSLLRVGLFEKLVPDPVNRSHARAVSADVNDRVAPAEPVSCLVQTGHHPLERTTSVRSSHRRHMGRLGLGLAAAAGTAALVLPTAAYAADAPPTNFASAQIGPAGGTVSGFGITVTFAPGAVKSARRIILNTSPSSGDVTPPSGETALVTFGLQECAADYTGCTSAFGNFPNSAAGSEHVDGRTVAFTGYQPLSTTPNSYGNTTLGSKAAKLVTISTQTAGTEVFIYNPNATDTAHAYPMHLPSTSAGGVNTFKTFMPIDWVIASRSSAASTGAAGTPTQVNAGTGGQAATPAGTNTAREVEIAALAAGVLLAGASGRRLIGRRTGR